MNQTSERPLLADIRRGYQGARAARRSERDARQQARRLRRELAAYTSPSDRHDLDAILARHSDEDAEPVRRLLSAGRAA